MRNLETSLGAFALNRNTKPDTTKLAGKFLTLSHHSSFHWHPNPVLLPGKAPWMEEPARFQSMGSLRVRQDWATSLSLSRVGEGNGNPLLYSCLENPRDGGAWWTAVCGVAQNRTWLKRFSSSSSSSGTMILPVCNSWCFFFCSNLVLLKLKMVFMTCRITENKWFNNMRVIRSGDCKPEIQKGRWKWKQTENMIKGLSEEK